ncbi:hypothetical protein PybrP1_003214 [[Pythium] brassicae (nom. inval.)]|nr:hypothetical protein PybrP1_003214 [[Pythium] brassicae (nom. inval.)]
MATPSAAQALEHGIVHHYNAEKGYGFIIDATITTAAERERATTAFFHISNCDVQTPEPRIGERVLFEKQGGPKRPAATAVYRVEINPPAAVGRANPPKESSTSAKPPAASGSTTSLEKAFNERRKLLAELPSFFQGGKHPRYVYVDLDNIWGFTQRLAEGEPGSTVSRLVAFYYNTPETIAAKLRTMGHNGVNWNVRRQETTTDTSMQLELLNAKRPCAAHPKTLVLVTGDGNIAPNSMCFREIMDLYIRDGWFVEVHAWLTTMARSYIEYQREYPSTVVIRPFDDGNVGEIYAAMINLLSNGGGEKHVSAGLAMLVQDVLDASLDTQQLVLTSALRELMNAAVWPKLSDEDSRRDKVGSEGALGVVFFHISTCNVQTPYPVRGEQHIVLVASLQNELDTEQHLRLRERTEQERAAQLDFGYTNLPSPVAAAPREPEPPRTMHCAVCMDDHLLEDVFLITGCDHTYCRDSMRTYILGKLHAHDVTPSCPHDGCETVLSDADLTSVLTADEQQQYYDTCLNLAVGSIPGVFKCLEEDCRGVAALSDDDPHFVCPLCDAERCVTCNTRQWHDGVTCAQHRQRTQDSELHPEQLRLIYGARAYQCARCGYGPIEHTNCSSLSAHHGERHGNAFVNNACPRCNWLAGSINEWPRWNGQLPIPLQPQP